MASWTTANGVFSEIPACMVSLTPGYKCEPLALSTSESSATINATLGDFRIGNEGRVTVTVTTSENHPLSTWGSTRLILQGKNSLCVNHGNHPLEKSRTYTEELDLEAPETIGEYDLLIQPFVTDDCRTEIGKEVLRTVYAQRPCLNCERTETDGKESEQVEDKVTTTTKLDAREERRGKIDAFMKAYQNDPGYSDIVVLVKLLIALDIIQI